MSKNTTLNIKNGTGAIGIGFDTEKKRAMLDVSDNYSTIISSDECYSNDGSVLYITANGYAETCKILLDSIKTGFEHDDRHKTISLIIPYFFNFRHYIEISLKAIILWSSDSMYEKSHDLSVLYEQAEHAVESIIDKPEMWKDSVTKERVIEYQDIYKEYLTVIKDEISVFIQNEPAVEYYRYIFDRYNDKKNRRSNLIIRRNMKASAVSAEQ